MFFGATRTARPAVPRGYFLASMSDPKLSALMIPSLGTLDKPQWRLLWENLKGYFMIHLRGKRRGASSSNSKQRIGADWQTTYPPRLHPFGAERCLHDSLQATKTVRNKRIISANARSVASGSKRGPSSRVKACSAGYSSVLYRT